MDFIAIDLETTGTLPYVDRIIEVAAIHFQDGKIINEFQSLVDPKILISPEITKINGITNDMVQSQPLIEPVLEEFAEFCKNYTLVAHNATFDFQFLYSAVKKFKSPAPSGPVLDTYSLAKKAMPRMVNYKLSTLVQFLKIKNDLFHRATEDARCCGYLFQHIMKELKTSDWKRLVQISGKVALKFPQIGHLNEQLNLFK